MKRVIIGIVVGLVLGSLVMAAEKAYTLRTIADFAIDPVKCAADGGKAALIAELDETGSLASEWEAYCVLAVK